MDDGAISTSSAPTQPLDPVPGRVAARIGTRLRGKWLLGCVLGVGGMAAVYQGTHRNGKRGAVKVLHTELAADKGVRERFLREGYVANKVAHAGAVAVLDDDVTDDGTVFLVMELLEGESLDQRVRRMGGRLEAGEVLAIADQLLDVLAAAHEKDIVHRDLKPENVFITADGRVKVLDFGIARLKEAAAPHTATQSGMTFGTPAYMPPEQAQGRAREVDARSDLWAVGATLFTLLTGRLVHEAETVNEMLIKAGTRPAPSISAILPELPVSIAGLIDRALAFQKAERWADARAMQAAVRQSYQSILGAPIATAPRLAAPIMERTQPSPGMAFDAGRAATGEPVSKGQSGVALRTLPRASRIAIAGGVAAALIALIALGTILVRHAESRPAGAGSVVATAALPQRSEAAGGTTASQPLENAPAAPPVSSVPAIVTPDELPAVASARSRPSRVQATAPPRSSSPGAASSSPAEPAGDWKERRR